MIAVAVEGSEIVSGGTAAISRSAPSVRARAPSFFVSRPHFSARARKRFPGAGTRYLYRVHPSSWLFEN